MVRFLLFVGGLQLQKKEQNENNETQNTSTAHIFFFTKEKITTKTEEEKRQRTTTTYSPTAESFGVSAQVGSGVVRGGPDIRFHEGSTKGFCKVRSHEGLRGGPGWFGVRFHGKVP